MSDEMEAPTTMTGVSSAEDARGVDEKSAAAKVPLIPLVPCDGEAMGISSAGARQSNLLQQMLGDDADEEEEEDGAEEEGGGQRDAIPLGNVSAEVLGKIVEFCEHNSATPMGTIPKPITSSEMSEMVGAWEARFVNDMPQELLFEVIKGANYMDIPDLLDLTCAKVASMIRGKTPEEIRIMFDIENDFTPEEEARVREENKWCEDL